MYTSLEQADDEDAMRTCSISLKTQKALREQNAEWSDITKFHSMPWVYWPLLI